MADVPDLTTEEALAIMKGHTTLDLIKVLGSVLAFLGLTLWLGLLLQRRFAINGLATGFLMLGGVHATLALAKPRLYWESGSALSARIRHSSRNITLMTLSFDAALIGIGLTGVVIALSS